MVTKLNSNCDKTQIPTKLRNSNTNKTQKLNTGCVNNQTQIYHDELGPISLFSKPHPQMKVHIYLQFCAWDGPGTREPDPWAKLHQNRTQKRQKICTSSRTRTGIARGSGSVQPEKASQDHIPPKTFFMFVLQILVKNRKRQ